MIEPKGEEPVRGKIGRVFLGVLKRAVGYRDLDAEVDIAPSKYPIREIQGLATQLELTNSARNQYLIVARMEIVSRQLGR